jgi:hypothetical protein
VTALDIEPQPRARLARVVWARLHQSIGWGGIAGLVLTIAAAAMLALAWSEHRVFLREQGAHQTGEVRLAKAIPAISQPAPTALLAPELPSSSEIPLLLTQIKQAAVSQGLQWRAAEYRVTAATTTQPASLEVRCTLKGPYPKLRAMLVQLMRDVPAFAIREFSASRPNADVADIEAKLLLAVFLQDGAPSQVAADVPSRTTP